MDRRDFLKTGSTLLSSMAIPASVAFAAPAPAPTPDSQAGRMILPINRRWRYRASKVAGAEAPGFDDRGFEQVVLPHTNVSMPWHNFDDKDYEFVSTYRRCFRLPPARAASASSWTSKAQ